MKKCIDCGSTDPENQVGEELLCRDCFAEFCSDLNEANTCCGYEHAMSADECRELTREIAEASHPMDTGAK